jgi:Glycosyltransferase like family
MLTLRDVTFAVAVNNRQIFNDNFFASPCFRRPHHYQLLIQNDFSSAAIAYNDAIEKSDNDLIVFAHQDIFLPELWLSALKCALDYLTVNDPEWGVLGCYGKTVDGRGWGHLYSSGRGVIGEPFERPVPIQTLDEIVLILRKSSGLRFDEHLPYFHLYGADVCLSAAKMGRTSYAISAFCIHNTVQSLVLPTEFYCCCGYIKRVWKDRLPIQTTCVRITRFNISLYKRRLREACLRVRGKAIGALRVNDPRRLLEEV